MLSEALPYVIRKSSIPAFIFFALQDIDVVKHFLSLTGFIQFGLVRQLVGDDMFDKRIDACDDFVRTSPNFQSYFASGNFFFLIFTDNSSD